MAAERDINAGERGYYGAEYEDEEEEDAAEAETSGSSDEKAASPGFTVTEINTYIKNIIECSPQLASVSVWGEISNLRPNKSGHIYFTLKDGGSVIKAVMWKGAAQRLSFDPKDGMKVAVHAALEMYVPFGYHQLIWDSMHRLGVGELYEAFEALKKKLEAEGLFRPQLQKKLPRFPKKIGIVTSPTGAAIRDMMNVMRRRSPNTELLIYAAAVQGGAGVEVTGEPAVDINTQFEGFDLDINADFLQMHRNTQIIKQSIGFFNRLFCLVSLW